MFAHWIANPLPFILECCRNLESVAKSIRPSLSFTQWDLNLALKSPHCFVRKKAVRAFFWCSSLLFFLCSVHQLLLLFPKTIQKSHFCKLNTLRETNRAISVAEEIRLAPEAPLKMLLAKKLSEPMMWLVAAAKSNCKTTVFSLDYSNTKDTWKNIQGSSNSSVILGRWLWWNIIYSVRMTRFWTCARKKFTDYWPKYHHHLKSLCI